MKIKHLNEAVPPGQAWSQHDRNEKTFEEEVQDYASIVEEAVDLLVQHPEYWGNLVVQRRFDSAGGRPTLRLDIVLLWHPRGEFIDVLLGEKKIISAPWQFKKRIQDAIQINYRKQGWAVRIADGVLVLEHERVDETRLVIKRREKIVEKYRHEGNLEYLENPTAAEIVGFLQTEEEARGVIDWNTGTVFLWGAHHYTHAEGVDKLNRLGHGLSFDTVTSLFAATDQEVKAGPEWNDGAMHQVGPIWFACYAGWKNHDPSTIRGFPAFEQLIRGLTRMKSPITEKREVYGSTPVWVNPSLQQIIAQSKREIIRGLSHGGNTYVWNAMHDFHYGMSQKIGGKKADEIRFVIINRKLANSIDRLGDESMEEFASSWADQDETYPHQRMIAPDTVFIYADSRNLEVEVPPVVARLMGRTREMTEAEVLQAWPGNPEKYIKMLTEEGLNEREDHTQTIPAKFWWHPREGLIEVEEHTGAIMDDPARFGIDPSGVDPEGNRIIQHELLMQAIKNGWVRAARMGHRFDLESPTYESAWGCVKFISNHEEIKDLLLETYDGPGGERRWVQLRGDQLEMFIRKGRVSNPKPKWAGFDDLSESLNEPLIPLMLYHGTKL